MTWLKIVDGKHWVHKMDGEAVLIYQTWKPNTNVSDPYRTWVQLVQFRGDNRQYEWAINRCVKSVRSDIDEVFTDRQQAIDATKAIAVLIGAGHITRDNGKEIE